MQYIMYVYLLRLGSIIFRSSVPLPKNIVIFDPSINFSPGNTSESPTFNLVTTEVTELYSSVLFTPAPAPGRRAPPRRHMGFRGGRGRRRGSRRPPGGFGRRREPAGFAQPRPGPAARGLESPEPSRGSGARPRERSARSRRRRGPPGAAAAAHS